MGGHLGSIPLSSQAFPGIVARGAGTIWADGAGEGWPFEKDPTEFKGKLLSGATGQNCSKQGLGKSEMLRLTTLWVCDFG